MTCFKTQCIQKKLQYDEKMKNYADKKNAENLKHEFEYNLKLIEKNMNALIFKLKNENKNSNF